MRNISDYKVQAEKCRKKAVGMEDPTHKKLLEEMAETWMMLAEVRAKELIGRVLLNPSMVTELGRH